MKTFLLLIVSCGTAVLVGVVVITCGAALGAAFHGGDSGLLTLYLGLVSIIVTWLLTFRALVRRYKPMDREVR
jgi:hypothetical protein